MRIITSVAALTIISSVFISTKINSAPVSDFRPLDEKAKIEQTVFALAKDMSFKCPIAKANDSVAFDTCRNALYNDSPLRLMLNSVTLWGRVSPIPDARLKDYHSTKFAPEVLSGMYLPLFMYSGQSKVEFNEVEGLSRAELGVAFRNQLQPGEFPYPFWHEDNKWAQYQDAKTVVLWINPETKKIVSAQFTPKGSMDVALVSQKVEHPKFDGNWSWTDNDGKQQPKNTLFDGVFSAKNPYLVKLDVSYKEFAISLRDGQCMACHVPNNPNKMKKLVLMQTPRHAAAEIGHIMDEVKRDKMPLTKWGMEEALPQAIKDVFITRGDEFAKNVAAAKEWENSNQAGFQGGVLKK
jgi:hypothetical protein